MHAFEWSRVGWLLPLSIALLVARCEDDRFAKRVTLGSEASTFWLELDAHAGRVIVGDPFASREEHGQVRIFRLAGDQLVEEARFYGGGDAVAIHGDRAAARLGEKVRIYERGAAGWRVATTISVAGCHERHTVGEIVLEADTLVLHTYEALCIAERRDNWAMKKLTATRFSTTEPVIRGDTLAFTEESGDVVTIYRRGRGWEKDRTIAVASPRALALSEDHVLAVGSEDAVVLFDIEDKPRRIATLKAQSRAGEYWGAELEIDRATLAVWNDDGVHVYRRSGQRWRAEGIVRSVLPESVWFGARLVLDGAWLWVGDPDMSDDSSRFPAGGFVHGYR